MKAAEEALKSPLLDSNDIFGTENILLNITSGSDEVRMGEIGDIIDFLQQAAGDSANIIWGNGYDAKLGNKISVTVIATGFKINPNRILRPEPVKETVKIPSEVPQYQKVDVNPRVVKEPIVPMEEIQSHFNGNSHEPFTVRDEVEKPDTKEQKRATVPEKNRQKPKAADSSEPIGNWFTRQFGGLFSDDDTEIKK
jgi:cell division protein FtsZ